MPRRPAGCRQGARHEVRLSGRGVFPGPADDPRHRRRGHGAVAREAVRADVAQRGPRDRLTSACRRSASSNSASRWRCSRFSFVRRSGDLRRRTSRSRRTWGTPPIPTYSADSATSHRRGTGTHRRFPPDHSSPRTASASCPVPAHCWQIRSPVPAQSGHGTRPAADAPELEHVEHARTNLPSRMVASQPSCSSERRSRHNTGRQPRTRIKRADRVGTAAKTLMAAERLRSLL